MSLPGAGHISGLTQVSLMYSLEFHINFTLILLSCSNKCFTKLRKFQIFATLYKTCVTTLDNSKTCVINLHTRPTPKSLTLNKSQTLVSLNTILTLMQVTFIQI